MADGTLVEIRPHTPPDALNREASGLSNTPCDSTQRRDYRYYCPLCMMYFGTMRKARCCGQYLCGFCEKDLGAACGDKACPYCSQENFEVEDVLDDDVVRDYRDSPAVNRRATNATANSVSPIATGATIEELRRKIVPLPQLPPLAAPSHLSNSRVAKDPPATLPQIRKTRTRPKMPKMSKPLEPQRHFVETDWCGCGGGGTFAAPREENTETSSVCSIM